ncbi:MAG: DUF3365 domain-containing protein [Planctomycetes bacterium]|nr:DUF3365 domain-containing protein [Planctomycetota bacterium]
MSSHPGVHAWIVLMFVASVASTSCSRPPVPPLTADEIEALETRADETAKRLGETLVRELKAAIAAGGAVNAVNVCGDTALRVAKEFAAEGVSMRRTSLKLRNVANAPDALERSVLDRWSSELPKVPESVAEVVDGPQGREYRFVKPIFVQGICVDCHGKPGALNEGVAAALSGKYPADQATGYLEGELRGAISVRMPVPSK